MSAPAPRKRWFGPPDDTLEETLSSLPRILSNDPELVCMQEALASFKKLEAQKGVRSRERALQWVMQRLGEDDHERMDSARGINE